MSGAVKFVKGLFSTPKLPKTQETVRLPSQGSLELQQTSQRRRKELSERRGRASTDLTRRAAPTYINTALGS